MGNKKAEDLPLMISDLVATPPEKPSGKRHIVDLDDLSVVPDDVLLIVHYGSKTFKATKAQLIGSLGKIYLTEGALLEPPVNGVIEYSGGHLYFTRGLRLALVGSDSVRTDTTTVVNTAVETVVFTHTFTANSFHADMRVFASATGVFSAASASETLTINFKLGGVAIHSATITPTNGIDIAWRAIHEGTISTDGASGTFIDFVEFSESGVAPIFSAALTPVAIDTTVENLYEVTVTWGAAKAGNSFSNTQADITYKH